jgi:hypothetical protein
LSDGGPASSGPEPSLQPPNDLDGVERPAGVLGTVKTLVFIVAIQLFALYITKVNAPAVASSGYSYQPAGTSSGGSIANVLILLIFVFAATLISVWLARKHKVKIFMAVIYGGTGVAIFLLTLLASIDVTSGYLGVYPSLYLSIGFASATLVVLALVSLRRIPSWFGLCLTGLLSAEVGSYFASTIPVLTALLLPVIFSLYDIYTVFKGPLRTLVTTLPESTLSAISSKIGDFSIGTGDTVFYAMIPALAYYQFTLGSAIVAMVAVDAGVVITLYLLGKVRLLPGLPIPMFMGLAAFLAFYFR